MLPASRANGAAPVEQGDAADSAAEAREKHQQEGEAALLKRPFSGWGDPGSPATSEEIEKLKKDLGTVCDPSDPTRKVAAKKANKAYMVHQRWKEEQIKSGRMDPKTGKVTQEPLGPVGKAFFLMLKWSVVGLLLSMAAGQFIAGDPIWGYRGKWVQRKTYLSKRLRVFTPAELALYNGRDEDRPIYLAILGNVYDVSANKRTYGPGGSYHFFSGTDASRAYVTGCFKYHCTHDLRGLDEDQIKQIETWKKFFDDHPTYKHVGTVELPEIDPESPEPRWDC
ncbi:cytochrome b5 [Tilletiaria anomala UBC 951]|uniref:Cytochrome b5 n=1 Tax=Tilletiaria anomala (strain ATCC 24038 / CBS 436.72 / UBC 951) TaxID=1037660 RepID=A0A066WJY6_TILAU|nr:cytochrome b5 [Tilletiaria anomala UBC 951]KDN52848.1 cytochrome b5 [Tilletiaria anomala UBC 951]